MSWQSSLELPTQATLPSVAAVSDDLLGREEVAAFLKMSLSSFDRAVKAGHLPAGVGFGAGKRWSKVVLTNFIYSKFVEQQVAAQSK